MAQRFTIFGGNGFIGTAVSSLLVEKNYDVHRVGRSDWPETGSELGDVIFTIGMTADFRSRLVETVETQIVRLHEALTRYSFRSFMYLSSARVYAGAASTQEETALLVRPWDNDHVYNISKLAAESLCFAYPNPKIRVVRLSNVYGLRDVSSLFLTAVMREAVAKGSVTIGQSPHSAKDYIWVEDVARSLVMIANNGHQRLYNVASGQNITHQEIAGILTAAGYAVHFKDNSPTAEFPPIDTTRFTEEFGLKPGNAREAISRVLHELRQEGTMR